MLNISSLAMLLNVLTVVIHEEPGKFKFNCLKSDSSGEQSYGDFLTTNIFHVLTSGCCVAANCDCLENFDFKELLKLLNVFLKNVQTGFALEYNQAADDEKRWLRKTFKKLLANSFGSEAGDIEKISAQEMFIFIIGLMMEIRKAISLKHALLQE